MNKSFVYTALILLIVGTCFSSFNDIEDNKRDVNPFWGRYLSKADDGPLKAEAYIIADVDYPNEPDAWKHAGRYGIHYKGYAKVSTLSWDNLNWGEEGYYNLKAEGNRSPRYKSVFWHNFAYRSLKDTYFKQYHGIAIESLNNSTVARIEGYLDTCYGKGFIEMFAEDSYNAVNETTAEADSN